MKNKKVIIRVLVAIIFFVLIMSMMINVNATTYEVEHEYINASESSPLEENFLETSDVSGKASPINIIVTKVIKILKIITFIIGIILLIKGIQAIIKKEVKKGILYIIISLLPFFASIMLDAIDLHEHNIIQ